MFIASANSCIKKTPFAKYTIQFGDTLSKLSKLTGESVETIANRNGIPDPDDIQAGRTIVILDPIKTCDILRKHSDSYCKLDNDDYGFILDCCERASFFKPLQAYVEPLPDKIIYKMFTPAMLWK